jgi:hypothetical protein
LRTPGVFGERGSGNLELPCQPFNEWLDRLLQLRQGDPGMAQERELNGKA